MALVRTKDRRTITLTDFSFADGEVTLVHPQDVPFMVHHALEHEPDGLEQYLGFCLEEGVTSTQDFLFLNELSVTEAIEFGIRLSKFYTDEPKTPRKNPMDLLLSDEDEDAIADFARKLGLEPDAVDPFDSDEEDDEK